jgi:hypothetical protein
LQRNYLVIFCTKENLSSIPQIEKAFNIWQTLLPILQRQPFVYIYDFFGPGELRIRHRPEKKRVRLVSINCDIPFVSFILKDKGMYWQLTMQLTIKNHLLQEYNIDTSFFIRHNHDLYMFASLRDAVIAEWIFRSGGMLTVFKEHFANFEKEILDQIRMYYPVEIIFRKNRDYYHETVSHLSFVFRNICFLSAAFDLINK